MKSEMTMMELILEVVLLPAQLSLAIFAVEDLLQLLTLELNELETLNRMEISLLE